MFRRSALALLALLAPAAGRTIMFGDSMFSNGAVKAELERLAGGVTIENSALTGASLHDGWVPSIVQEYDMIRKNPVPITAIVDGGGNDVFSVESDCKAFDDKCKQQINEAIDIMKTLLEKMDQDGIAHVLFMGPFYAHELNQAVDYGVPKIRAVCQNAAIDCQFVDTRSVNPPKGGDGIHPTDEGYKMLAHAIWEVKLKHNIPIA